MDDVVAIFAGYSAVEEGVIDVEFVESFHEELVASDPLAEDDDFLSGVFEDFDESVDEFVGFGSVFGFRVDEVGAVGGHAHGLEGGLEAFLVCFGEEAVFSPFEDEFGDDVFE